MKVCTIALLSVGSTNKLGGNNLITSSAPSMNLKFANLINGCLAERVPPLLGGLDQVL